MTSANTTVPRPPGRPPTPPEQALTASIHERITKAQKDKYKRLGAGDWLRSKIDKAKE